MRVACVRLPALDLQWTLKTHPEWQNLPVATVSIDTPHAPLCALNRVARRAHLHSGMRQSAAKQLLPDLRTAVVSQGMLNQIVSDVADVLHDFTPSVEYDESRPGVYVLDAEGLYSLYLTLEKWGLCLQKALLKQGLRSAITIGFTAHGTLALSYRKLGVRVLSTPQEEMSAARAMALAKLAWPQTIAETCKNLRVDTLGMWLQLPRAEVQARLGAEAKVLHETFSGDRPLALKRWMRPEPMRVRLEVDPPDDESTRLLFGIKGALDSLLYLLRCRHQALGRLYLRFELERAANQEETIDPASPTQDAAAMLELVRLRMMRLTFSSAVVAIELEAEPSRGEAYQPWLLGNPVRYDAQAASRTLAQLRAAFGEIAVRRAVLADAHLPEAKFRWEPMAEIKAPCPQNLQSAFPLMRRLSVPTPLATTTLATFRGYLEAHRQRDVTSKSGVSTYRQLAFPGFEMHTHDRVRLEEPLEPAEAACVPVTQLSFGEQLIDGQAPIHKVLSGMKKAPLMSKKAVLQNIKHDRPSIAVGETLRLEGPHRVSGGWWVRTVERDYYYLQSAQGVHWIYYDQQRKRWYLHGHVD